MSSIDFGIATTPMCCSFLQTIVASDSRNSPPFGKRPFFISRCEIVEFLDVTISFSLVFLLGLTDRTSVVMFSLLFDKV